VRFEDGFLWLVGGEMCGKRGKWRPLFSALKNLLGISEGRVTGTAVVVERFEGLW
jgi:hypothetical protein